MLVPHHWNGYEGTLLRWWYGTCIGATVMVRWWRQYYCVTTVPLQMHSDYEIIPAIVLMCWMPMTKTLTPWHRNSFQMQNWTDCRQLQALLLLWGEVLMRKRYGVCIVTTVLPQKCYDSRVLRWCSVNFEHVQNCRRAWLFMAITNRSDTLGCWSTTAMAVWTRFQAILQYWGTVTASPSSGMGV